MQSRGFTIVEMLVGLSVLAVVLVLIIGALLDVSSTSREVRSTRQLDSAALVVVSRLLSESRDADDLDELTSVFDSGNGVLDLSQSSDSGTRSVSFSLSNGVLGVSVDEGGGPVSEDITPSDVYVDSFTIRNLSVTDKSEGVRAEVTMTSPSGNETVTYYATAMLRGSY